MYMWLSSGFFLIPQMGAQIGVSQSLGRGDKKTALAFFQNAFCLAVWIGVAYAAVMVVCHEPLIGFFHYKEADVARNASDYLAIVGIAMPCNFVLFTLGGAFQGAGNSRTPFIINLWGVITNVILDPILILGFHMGVPGAAIATAMGQIVSFCAAFITIYRLHVKPFEGFILRMRFEKAYIQKILKWGVPVGVQNLLFCFLSMITARILTRFGALAVAADKIGNQVESLSWMIGGGYGSALVAFIGQNYGARQWERIRRGIRISFAVMITWTALVTVFLWTGGPSAFSLFLPGADAHRLGVIYLRIISFCEIIGGVEAVCTGVFNGTGRTIPPAICVILCNGLRPILAWFLSETSWGVSGVWLGIMISAVLRGALILVWYLIYSRKLMKGNG
jgi:putative MATE family efflux protein